MPNDDQQQSGQQGGQQQSGQQQSGEQGGQQQSGQQGGQSQTPWHGYTDPADVAYVTNKGWKGPTDAIKSYREAESFMKRDPSTLLVMPRADDPEGFRAVMQKLGLPDKPEAYDMKIGLPKEAKVDETFAKSMQSVLHKAGILPAQAQTLIGEYNAMELARQAQAVKDYELNVQADKQALLDEWRGGHDRMMNRAKTAATSLGFTPELIDAVEKQMGYAATYKLFAAIGEKLGEDNLVSGGVKSGFDAQLTPAEAKTQHEALRSDPNHVKALTDPSHPGHKAAQEKENKLFAIMFPGGK